MSAHAKSQSAEIRSRLSHPVIDSDGHTVESMAVFLEYLADVAGPRVVERFPLALEDTFGDPRWMKSSEAAARYCWRRKRCPRRRPRIWPGR